jgi:hypothetical protein
LGSRGSESVLNLASADAREPRLTVGVAVMRGMMLEANVHQAELYHEAKAG